MNWNCPSGRFQSRPALECLFLNAGDVQPMATEDDSVRFPVSVAGGNHFPTKTRCPETRINTGSDLAHAREAYR